MEIQNATLDDLDELVRLGRAMRDESTVPFPEIDPAAVAAHLRLAMDNPERLFVAIAHADRRPAGFVSGAIGPYAFSQRQHASSDLLFVLPEFRGRYAGVRLLRALSDWAKTHGAGEIELGLSTGIASDRTEELVERIGFVPLGRTFRKEIEPCAMPQHSP